MIAKRKGVDFNISQEGTATLGLPFLNFNTLGFTRNLAVLSDHAKGYLNDEAWCLRSGLRVSVTSTKHYDQKEQWRGKSLSSTYCVPDRRADRY